MADTSPSPTSARLHPLISLRHRDFRILFLGLLVSMIGSQITRATTAWQIYELTDSAFALGLAIRPIRDFRT